jgi:polar amino acid transport system substrate-binding protein
MRRLGILGLLGGLALAIGAAGSGLAQDQEVAESSVVEQIKQRGAMQVGLSTFVPWSMHATDGELIGFEVDVAKQLAEDMGVEIEFVPTAWDGIIPALIAGKFDLIISGMSVTPARNLTVNFTIPYAHSGVGFTASQALAGDFKSIEDFNQPDVKLAFRRGATPASLAKILWPEAQHLLFDDDAQAVQEVLAGNAHGVASSEPKPTFWTIENPDILFQPFDGVLKAGSEAFALRKGDPDALNFFNNWIALKVQDGWLQERHDYWFKTRDWADRVAG